MMLRTAMWILVKFDEVIRAIENPLGADLFRYNEAGVLWTVTDSKGHSPLLYFFDKKTTDPKYSQADFVKHVRTLASVDPIQTEVGFRTGALQLLTNKDFILLKALFDQYAILEPFITNSEDPEKFRSLYAQILAGLSQFNAQKGLSNPSRDQPTVLDRLFGELQKAAFQTIAMREGLIAALENDTETKLAIVKKILRYAHQQDNIIPLLQGATDNENIFVLLKKKSGAAYRIEMLLKSLALIYRQESNTQDALSFLHVVKMTDYEKSIVLKALTEKKLDVKKTSCEAPLSFSSVALSNNSLSYYAGDALSGWCNNNHLTVLDLSNNPSLGSGHMCFGSYYIYHSGLQLLAKSLAKNTTLRKLILARCGVNDRDFSTLVWMLKLNSALKVLDLSHNQDITEKAVQAKLPSLYQHRYRYRDQHSFSALRPRLDAIIKMKNRSQMIDTTQTVFQQNIRAHIEQLRLHSLGAQIKTKNAPADHGSAWDKVAHFFHMLVLVSSAGGVVLAIVEIIQKKKLTVGTIKHGLHKAEDIKVIFEFLSLGVFGLKIVNDIIFAICNGKLKELSNVNLLSDEFYYRWEQHGLIHTTVRTLVDFLQDLYELLVSAHHHDLTEFFEKFDSLAIALNIDKTVAELSHNFKSSEQMLDDSYEVELLTDAVAQYFKQFCKDPHITIDWSCVAQDFSHWVLAKELECFEVTRIKRGLVIFTGHEDTERELLDQSDDEWTIDIIRRRGFQCHGNDNKMMTFNVKYKKLSADKKSHEWITTDGDRFGYYPIGKNFLRIIQEKIQGYKKENAETRIIRIDNVAVEYEILEEEMEGLRHHTLTAILSDYQPTEEQLSNIRAAINDLGVKVEALRMKTEENTAEIARVKETVDSHATKHQQTDEKLDSLKEANQRIAELGNENKDQKILIEALEKRAGALESVNIILKKMIDDQQDTITKHEAALENLTARVDALVDQQGHAIAAAGNAALNADIAAHRADRQEAPLQGQQLRRNNNQEQAAAGNGAVLHENQVNEEERDPPNTPVHIDQNLSRADDTQDVNSINLMK